MKKKIEKSCNLIRKRERSIITLDRLGKFSLSLGNFPKGLQWSRVVLVTHTSKDKTIDAFHGKQCTVEHLVAFLPLVIMSNSLALIYFNCLIVITD